MNHKPIIILICCLFFSLMMIVLLYEISDISSDHHQSFKRYFQTAIIQRANEIDIKYNSYYIAGITTNHIYLGNTTGILHMLITDINLTDTLHKVMSIKNRKSLKLGALQVKVDSPYFYLSDGMLPAIFRGNID